LLTHIHLNHAGAAGWLAGFGAQIESLLIVYDLASPAQMGASGLFRYWDKLRTGRVSDFTFKYLPVLT